jgi:hypothetical protein
MSDDILFDKQSEQKLKFVEILLIVGGIIASLGVKGPYFGGFLIFSLLYYFSLSNMRFTSKTTKDFVYISFLALFVAIFFTLLVISSIEFSTILGFPSIYWKISFIIFNVILIYVNLLPSWLVPQRLKKWL